MTKHKVQMVEVSEAERFLDGAARQGWRLVSVITHGTSASYCVVFMVREE